MVSEIAINYSVMLEVNPLRLGVASGGLVTFKLLDCFLGADVSFRISEGGRGGMAK